MTKRTDLLYRNLFLPEWDGEMDAFFDIALAELQRYSEEKGSTEWYTQEPEIAEFEGAFQVAFVLPGLENDSIIVDLIDNVLILSGLRRTRTPFDKSEKLVSFRRIVELPKNVNEENWHVFRRDDGTLVLFLAKRGSALDSKAASQLNGKNRKRKRHSRKRASLRKNPNGRPANPLNGTGRSPGRY